MKKLTNSKHNIYFFGENALTFHPSGIIKNNPSTVDILRINPEEIGKVDAQELINNQIAQYPTRVFNVLLEESKRIDNEKLFQLGTYLLGIESPTLVTAMRERFYKRINAGSVSDGIKSFAEYAQALIRNTPLEQLDAALKKASAQVMAEPNNLLAQRAQQLYEALDDLPRDIVEAVNMLGVRIVINEADNACHYANDTIYIRRNRFDKGGEYLRAVLKEEMVHYIDSFLEFTEQKAWHEANQSNIQIKEAELTTDEIEELLAHPENLEPEQLKTLLEIVNQRIKHASSAYIGKKVTDKYDEVDRATELLPDIMHARERMIFEGVAVDEIDLSLSEVYGAQAVQLVETFLQEAKQVADGTHPKLLEALQLEVTNETDEAPAQDQAQQHETTEQQQNSLSSDWQNRQQERRATTNKNKTR